MALSVRLRFEIFKRDEFTCRYCGKASPEVVLEVDHVVPQCEGGSDDPMNLVTACFSCNRGKSGISLNEVLAAEDPHDRAILLLERERQLREYNTVLAVINERVENDVVELCDYWKTVSGRAIYGKELNNLARLLETYPSELIRRAMLIAINNYKVGSLAYVTACLRNWTQDRQAVNA